jgi:hypothetical protein
MKKYLSITLFTILLVSFVTGCKKTNSATPKDYTPSIKDKTWWGMFTYTGKDAEYYSVHFNADNTLLWSQFSGDFTGQWAINGQELTMTFDVSKAAIKAGISDDDKLLNITDNTGNFEINAGQLVADPNIPLDNTLWEGKPVLASGLYGYQMEFMPALKITIQETYFIPPSLYQSYFYPNNTYKRSASGAVIRASYNAGGAGAGSPFFGVIISGTEMRGSIKNPNNSWKATKQ